MGVTRPVLDLERGYLVTPMARGLRLTTGAEFARLNDPPSPAHLGRLEPFARELFPLGPADGAAPWLGRRPCLPDMRPVIGPFPGKPGLWLDFAHHHLGLTLGPISGRLIAEMMSGEAKPLVDPAPFRAERFISGGLRDAADANRAFGSPRRGRNDEPRLDRGESQPHRRP